MDLRDVFDDREPEPCPPLISAPGFIDSVKPFEQSWQVFLCDADALIAHRNDHSAGVGLRFEPDRTAGLAVVDGVIEKVDQCLFYKRGVYQEL